MANPYEFHIISHTGLSFHTYFPSSISETDTDSRVPFLLLLGFPHFSSIHFTNSFFFCSKPASVKKNYTQTIKKLFVLFFKTFFRSFHFFLFLLHNNYWSMMLDSLMLIKFSVVVAPIRLLPVHRLAYVCVASTLLLFLRICCGACFLAFTVAIIFFYE